MDNNFIERINKLKQERNAVIVAHKYFNIIKLINLTVHSFERMCHTVELYFNITRKFGINIKPYSN